MLCRNKVSIIYFVEVKYLDNEKAWKDLSRLSRRFYKPIVFLPFQGNQVTVQLTIVIANKNDVCYLTRPRENLNNVIFIP